MESHSVFSFYPAAFTQHNYFESQPCRSGILVLNASVDHSRLWGSQVFLLSDKILAMGWAVQSTLSLGSSFYFEVLTPSPSEGKLPGRQTV